MIQQHEIREALNDYANFLKLQPVGSLEKLAEVVRADAATFSEQKQKEFVTELEGLVDAESRLHEGSGLTPGAIQAFDHGFVRLGVAEVNQAALVGLIVGVRAQRLSEERSGH